MRDVGCGAMGRTGWPGLLSPGGVSVSGFEREGGIGPEMVENVAHTGLACGFFV